MIISGRGDYNFSPLQVIMLELKKEKEHIVSIEQLIEKYQHHPSMQRVKIFTEKLKQEKLEDKIFYQSAKDRKVPRR